VLVGLLGGEESAFDFLGGEESSLALFRGGDKSSPLLLLGGEESRGKSSVLEPPFSFEAVDPISTTGLPSLSFSWVLSLSPPLQDHSNIF